ncbi:MAG: hypothetical protein LBH30_01200 [Prevotellaceae bacterium]|nr:hypothetical protein [Prevotellaceae bacterium]
MKITQWTLTMAIAITLAACATSGRYSSTVDDIYYSPAKVEIASTVQNNRSTTVEDAEIQQLKSETQAAIIQNAQKLSTEDSTIVVVEDASPYRSVVSDSYEDSYERRLRGYNSPSYGVENVIRITSGSDWMQVSSYDPAFYNIIVMGDEIWVEPKYITNMFAPVRTTINLGWGLGYYGGYWDYWYRPSFGFSWGWNTWYTGWYSPWSWHYPYYGSYWGWGYGWNGYWGYGHHHHHYPGSHYGYGNSSVRNTYGRRTGGTMGQHRVSSANINSSEVSGRTRRETRNIELVSNRTTNGTSTSTSVNAGNRRGNSTVNASTGSASVNQTNVTGRTRNPQNVTTDRMQTGQQTRRNTQVYTRPSTASKQGYNESTTSSSVSRRSSTNTTGTGITRIGTSTGSKQETTSRSVSTSRYKSSENSTYNNSRSNSGSGSSQSVSRRSSSSSSNSSYTPSSSSGSSRSSGSISSGSSSRSGGGSSSGGGGGGRRR